MMTECIPSTTYSYKPKQHFRRSSITQATISSIAKDVRSKEDDVCSLLRKKNNPRKPVQAKRASTRSKVALEESHCTYLPKKCPEKNTPYTLSCYASSDSLSSLSSLDTHSSSVASVVAWPFAQPPPHSHPLRDAVLEDLACVANSYSHHLQDLTHIMSYSTLDQPFQSARVIHAGHIEDCKALLAQQHLLLDRLHNFVLQAADQPPPEPSSVALSTQKPPVRTSLQKLKDALVCPTGVTALVIRKQRQQTHILVQGVCQTAEASLVAPHLASLQPRPLYFFRYSLSLDAHDRANAFAILPPTLWQPDSQVTTCQFKPCTTPFGFFHRKHHCRRCGDIYCHKHSQNRLPLFTRTSDTPHFSRVCDTCFFELAGAHLSVYI
ncbi:FYVE zinc finger-domain-containing protein [Sporodiniella umbellata]|nr:FYVE zinc finger-domain-containing protein [Sporodiniella umbellata]